MRGKTRHNYLVIIIGIILFVFQMTYSRLKHGYHFMTVNAYCHFLIQYAIDIHLSFAHHNCVLYFLQ